MFILLYTILGRPIYFDFSGLLWRFDDRTNFGHTGTLCSGLGLWCGSAMQGHRVHDWA